MSAMYQIRASEGASQRSCRIQFSIRRSNREIEASLEKTIQLPIPLHPRKLSEVDAGNEKNLVFSHYLYLDNKPNLAKRFTSPAHIAPPISVKPTPRVPATTNASRTVYR